MDTAERKCANTSLSQLGQAFGDETAIFLIRGGCIKKVTRLHKEINALPYGKICYLLKRAAQALPAILAFAGILTEAGITQVIVCC
jgi:hypothetical protein